MTCKNILYIASRDIGNFSDNTKRFEETVKECSLILVESFKNGSTLLKKIGVKKEMREISEHTTEEEIEELALLMVGKTTVMLSDGGSAALEDPGRGLIARAYENGITVSVLPGASSLTSAIMACPFTVKRFVYGSLLSRNSSERKRELKHFLKLGYPLIILEAPYRLKPLIEDIAIIYPKTRKIFIAFDISGEKEEFFDATVEEALKCVGSLGAEKRPFVVIVDGDSSVELATKQKK